MSDRWGSDRTDVNTAVAERVRCSSFPPGFTDVPFRVDAGEQEAKKSRLVKSASYESIVLCSNSKKEVRQYGAQRPSLDVAFTCERDIALNG